MGLFDSIRRAVGGGDDGSEQTEARSDLVDVTALGPDEFRDRAENAASDGDPLDFSVTSLERLDEAIAGRDDWTEDTPSDGTAYSPKAVQFGSYFGEVLVRTYDGEWTAEHGWAVTGPDDEVTVDVFEVAARSVGGDPVFAAVAERLDAELDRAGQTAVEAPDADTDEREVTEDAVDTASAETSDADDTADTQRDVDLIAPDDETGDESATDADAGDPTQGATDDVETETTDALSDPADDAVYPTFDVVEPTATEVPPDESEPSDPSEAAPAETSTEDAETDTATEDRPESAEVSDSDEVAESVTPAETDDDPPVTTDEPDADGVVADRDASAPERDDEGTATKTTDPTPASDPTAGDGLRAEYAATATEFTDFWAERDLDFTPASLARLDDLVGTEWDDDRFEDATFGSEATFDDRAFTSVTTELGSYFGEVLVRELDGEWSADADHEAVVVVSGTDGPLAVPVFQVAANSLRTVPVFARSYEALLADLGRDA